jgi:excinuclease ABC subunit B
MYADRMTGSMEKAISETNRRRAIQMEYNEANGISPKTIFKSREAIMGQTLGNSNKNYYVEPEEIRIAADPVVQYMAKPELQKLIAETQRKMEIAAKELNFLEAARYRDEILQLKEKVKQLS